MKNKVTIVFSIFVFALFLDACRGIDCGCDPIIPFFDFEGLEIEIEDTEIGLDETLDFKIMPVEFTFFAQLQKSNCQKPFFIGSAMACDCKSNGTDGLKFDIVGVRVISNADWSGDLPAGSNLVELLLFDRLRINDYKLVTEEFGNRNFFNMWFASHFRIEERPTEVQQHTLTFEFIKSNGVVAAVTSAELEW